MGAKCWYTMFCKPRKEAQVADYLVIQNIKTYYPTLYVDPANTRSLKVRPYFPRYIFLYADLEEVDARVLQSTPGSIGLVQFSGEPSALPDDFIPHLKARIAAIEAAGGLNLDGLKKGDSVYIRSGAFEGYEALFDEKLSGEQRVQVLLYWLGREIKVKIDSQNIEKGRRRRG